MFRRIAVAAVLFAVSGCGSDIKTAPVSGTVYMNGKPLVGAHVLFQPIGSKDNPNPGRGSYGATNEHGRFKLRYDGQRDGAVVGQHRVAIATIQKGESNFNPQTGSPDGAPAGGKETIPARYNDKTTLTFNVPPGGTDKADFQLTLP